MTDHPPNRLWPLALLGWLAAFPPQGREAAAGTLDSPHLEQPGSAGTPANPTSTPTALPAEAPRRRRRRMPAT